MVDDRTLHELYLWPFAEGVHAGVGSVMTAYNAINGSACSQNPMVINGILKEELGFQGFVMSDWLSHMSGVDSALAGLDMSMPGDTQIPLFGHSYWKYDLTKSVLNGSVPLDRLNDMATRIVATWYQMGQDKDFGPPNFSSHTRSRNGLLYPAAVFSPTGQVNWFVNVQADHYKVARQVAQDAITLLKNTDGFLPLATKQPLRVFGTAAQANPAGPNACPNRACNTGTLGMGWGSGVADYPYLDDPIAALRRRASDVHFWNRDSFPLILSPAAKDDDVAIVFITSDAGENFLIVEGNNGDRDKSRQAAWHGGDRLVEKAAAKYKNVVVVVQTVGPIIMESWIDNPNVKAVLFQHLPGQEAGESLTNILFGDASPSGRLPYSITKKEDDLPASLAELVGHPFGQVQDTYTEGLYIDYRYLQKNGIKPRFAFGHGLSYTKFSYSDATIKRVNLLSLVPPARGPKGPTPAYSKEIPDPQEAYKPEGFDKIWRYLYSWMDEKDADAAHAVGRAGVDKYDYPEGYSETQTDGLSVPAGGDQGGNAALWDVAYEITLTVKNVGDTGHAGKASVQAYLQFPEDCPYDTPVLQLRDFEKTKVLAPGESTRVTLRLKRKDVSVWDAELQNWVVPVKGNGGEDAGNDPGYSVWIGESSERFFVRCETRGLSCEVGGENEVGSPLA